MIPGKTRPRKDKVTVGPPWLLSAGNQRGSAEEAQVPGSDS